MQFKIKRCKQIIHMDPYKMLYQLQEHPASYNRFLHLVIKNIGIWKLEKSDIVALWLVRRKLFIKAQYVRPLSF